MTTPTAVTIDGLEFEVPPLNPFKAWALMARLGAALGPVLMATLQAVLSGKMKAGDVNPAAVASSLPGLFDRLSPEDLDGITRELLGPAKVKDPATGKMVGLVQTADLILYGKLPVLMQVTWHALKVNYGDFGPALGALATLAKGKASQSRSEGFRGT